MTDPRSSEDTPGASVRSSTDPVPSPHPLHRLFFGADGLRSAWGLLVFFALVALVQAATVTVMHHLHSPSPDDVMRSPLPGLVFFSRIVPFLAIALVTLLMARIERRSFASYGIGITPGLLRQFVGGLGWGVLFLSLLVAVLTATRLLAWHGIALSGMSVLRFGSEWLLSFLAVALFEEFLTRGYLLFTVARGIGGVVRVLTRSPRSSAIGFWSAALLTSFLFGFAHKTNPGESSFGLASASLIGFVFCLSLWRTGSLWWALGFHASWDWAQSFLFGTPDSGHIVSFHLFNTQANGTPLLSGGLTGPEGSVYILPIIGLATVAVLLTTHRRGWPPAGSALSADRPRTLPPSEAL